MTTTNIDTPEWREYARQIREATGLWLNQPIKPWVEGNIKLSVMQASARYFQTNPLLFCPECGSRHIGVNDISHAFDFDLDKGLIKVHQRITCPAVLAPAFAPKEYYCPGCSIYVESDEPPARVRCPVCDYDLPLLEVKGYWMRLKKKIREWARKL